MSGLEFGETVGHLGDFLVVIELTDLVAGEYRVSREEVCASAKRSGVVVNDEDTYEIIDCEVLNRCAYFLMRVIRGGNTK